MKVKHAMVKSVYYIKEYTIDCLVMLIFDGLGLFVLLQTVRQMAEFIRMVSAWRTLSHPAEFAIVRVEKLCAQ
jgi:hypothetical protein